MCDVSMKYLWRTCSVCLVYDAFHCGVHVALLWRFILTCSIHRLYRLYAMYLGLILYRSSSNTMGYILKKFMKEYNQKKR